MMRLAHFVDLWCHFVFFFCHVQCHRNTFMHVRWQLAPWNLCRRSCYSVLKMSTQLDVTWGETHTNVKKKNIGKSKISACRHVCTVANTFVWFTRCACFLALQHDIRTSADTHTHTRMRNHKSTFAFETHNVHVSGLLSLLLTDMHCSPLCTHGPRQ